MDFTEKFFLCVIASLIAVLSKVLVYINWFIYQVINSNCNLNSGL